MKEPYYYIVWQLWFIIYYFI